MTNVVRLGDKVRDTVTGFTGIVIARTDWLYGCTRITVQPDTLTKEGKMYETQTFDEPQVQLVESAVAGPGMLDRASQKLLVRAARRFRRTGGPRPTPESHPAPRR